MASTSGAQGSEEAAALPSLPSLPSLPKLVWHRIASFLDPYDRIAFSSSCTTFREAVRMVLNPNLVANYRKARGIARALDDLVTAAYYDVSDVVEPLGDDPEGTHDELRMICEEFKSSLLRLAAQGLEKEKEKKLVTQIGKEALMSQTPCFSLDWFKWAHGAFASGRPGHPTNPRRGSPRGVLHDSDLARLAIVPLAPIMALGASAGGDAKPSAGGNGDDEVAAFLVTGVRPTEGARLAGVC